MQLALEGGTETGSMLLFDPGSLPPEIDHNLRRSRRLLRKLAESGALYRIPQNAEGWFTLRAFLDEPLPPQFECVAELVDSEKLIEVKDGRLFFTGSEYAFHRDDALLRKYPSMGGHQSIPAGTYALDLFALSYPEGFHEAMLKKRTASKDRRVRSTAHSLGMVLAFAPVFFVFFLFVLPWRLSQSWVIPVMAAALTGAWMLIRAAAYQRTAEQEKMIYREFSDYAMVLRRMDARVVLDYVI
jgi:hypothetical protein